MMLCARSASSALNIDIFPGIIIIYLKACLLAALTLFVSTFATTNIFTIVVMVFRLLHRPFAGDRARILAA